VLCHFSTEHVAGQDTCQQLCAVAELVVLLLLLLLCLPAVCIALLQTHWIVLLPACPRLCLQDTFFGKCRLRVWKLDSQGRIPASAVPIVDARSSTAALEVGGGPWWGPWSAKARMLEPFRSLVQLPIDVGVISRTLPDLLKPPGL
jgi:hypothetical protein